VFKDPKYASAWSKSGAPVVRQEGDQFVMTRIEGYYYMYYGETNLYLAQSKTLTDWAVLEDAEKDVTKKRCYPARAILIRAWSSPALLPFSPKTALS
jgi:hypothetical protein